MLGCATDGELQNVSEGVAALGSRKIYVDDAGHVTPMQARSKLRRLQNLSGVKLGLVVIDYLQLMAPMPDDRRTNRKTSRSAASRGR